MRGAQHEGEILTFASRTMWNRLLALGLTDELHLMLGPKASGVGSSMFDAPTKLSLLGTQSLQGSDNVLLRYQVESR